MKVCELTYDELSEALDYNPLTGAFTWKIDVARNVKKGSPAGSLKTLRVRTTGQVRKYLYIRLRDREMVASRVAWLLYYKEWPSRSVMCIDGNSENLKIDNLRLAQFEWSRASNDGRKSCKIPKEYSRGYGLKRYYGLSIAEYAEKFRAQDGKCAICGLPEVGKDRHGNVRPLAVDHCHASGAVRDLLCYACNSMLGQARDNVNVLLAGAAYLKKHSAEGTPDMNPETSGGPE